MFLCWLLNIFFFILSFLSYQYVWIDNVHTTFLKSGVSSSQHDKWKIIKKNKNQWKIVGKIFYIFKCRTISVNIRNVKAIIQRWSTLTFLNAKGKEHFKKKHLSLLPFFYINSFFFFIHPHTQYRCRTSMNPF